MDGKEANVYAAKYTIPGNQRQSPLSITSPVSGSRIFRKKAFLGSNFDIFVIFCRVSIDWQPDILTTATPHFPRP